MLAEARAAPRLHAEEGARA